MRLNNFCNKNNLLSKQQENTKSSIDFDSQTQIDSGIKIRIHHEKCLFQTETLHYDHKIFFKNNQIVTQTVETQQFSIFNVLGKILLKIMAYQIISNGYSSIKLNIIKAINQIQENKILLKYHKLFHSNINLSQMLSCLNKYLKQIEQVFAAVLYKKQSFINNQKQLFCFQFQSIRIHKIVINQVKQQPILFKFFQIFFACILLLVNFPIQKQTYKNQNQKEILFILCDYLGCKIEENQGKFIIDKIHFIKINENFIQFGNLRQNNFTSKNKKLTGILSQNPQTRSTNDLLSFLKSKKQKNLHSGRFTHTDSQKLSTYSQKIKKFSESHIFTDEQKIQLFDSQMKPRIIQTSQKYSKQKNLTKNERNKRFLFPYKNLKKYNSQRRSLKLMSLKNIQFEGYKCSKCLSKMQLKLVSKTIDYRL